MEIKPGAATPTEYPLLPKAGHYSHAFKKGTAEREAGKRLKEEWKVLINAEFGHILPKKLLKKVNNPTKVRLAS